MTNGNRFVLWGLPRKCLLRAALSLWAFGMLVSPSLADKPKFRLVEIGGGFGVETLYVDQNDGRWTKTSGHVRTIPYHLRVDMSRGYIVRIETGRALLDGAVRVPSTSAGRNWWRVDAATSDERHLALQLNNLTRLHPSDESAIVDGCNAKPDQAADGHSFNYSIPLAVHVDAKRHRRPKAMIGTFGDEAYAPYGDSARGTATGFVGVKIVCMGTDAKYPRGATTKPPSDPDAQPRATGPVPSSEPVEVLMNLDVAGGNACPRNARITTRIVYEQAKTARFDIVRNGKVLKTVEIKARREPLSDGSTQWVVDRIDDVEAKAGQNQFRVVVKGGGRSAMKVANIECAPFEILFSDLQYNVAGGGSCPKKVWETATFSASGPGTAVLQLVQENGSVFYEKQMETILKNGAYKLVNQRVLSIDRDTDRKFRAQIKGQSGVHSKWAELKVTCPKRTNPRPEAKKPGADHLTAEPRSTASPEKPKRVSPEPKQASLVCKGGKVANGKCRCGANRTLVKIGKAAFACQKQAVRTNPEPKKQAEKPKRVNPEPKQASLVCKGGKVANGKCRCGPNRTLVKIGKAAFACQKQAARANPEPRKNAEKPKRVQPQQTRQNLVCQGGKVQGGKCRCGQKKVAKKVGNRQFACVPRKG
jgi:hypothetical protein